MTDLWQFLAKKPVILGRLFILELKLIFFRFSNSTYSFYRRLNRKMVRNKLSFAIFENFKNLDKLPGWGFSR